MLEKLDWAQFVEICLVKLLKANDGNLWHTVFSWVVGYAKPKCVVCQARKCLKIKIFKMAAWADLKVKM